MQIDFGIINRVLTSFKKRLGGCHGNSVTRDTCLFVSRGVQQSLLKLLQRTTITPLDRLLIATREPQNSWAISGNNYQAITIDCKYSFKMHFIDLLEQVVSLPNVVAFVCWGTERNFKSEKLKVRNWCARCELGNTGNTPEARGVRVFELHEHRTWHATGHGWHPQMSSGVHIVSQLEKK